MAKFEKEGYCPCDWIPHQWNEKSDNRLPGLWSLVGPSIVYEAEDEAGCTPDTEACDEIFAKDPIACDLLSSIVRKGVNADKILVRQLHSGGCNVQRREDIQAVLAMATKPELIVHYGSNFAVVLATADYGMDVWVWDLRNTR